MIDRFINRTIVKNSQDMYEILFRERGIKFINQYITPQYIYPDSTSIKSINVTQHVWSLGDRYYKLANTYYGDPSDWWIIAKFNNKPTESHVKIGDILYIPLPLQQIMKIMRG